MTKNSTDLAGASVDPISPEFAGAVNASGGYLRRTSPKAARLARSRTAAEGSGIVSAIGTFSGV